MAPQKSLPCQKERILFQASFLRGELLLFRGVVTEILVHPGINVGSPADTSEYTLGYASSKAYKHEFLDDWGGKGGTYVLVPRQLGGGPHQKMKKTHKLAILKSKCTNASAKASCDALAGDLLVQASQVYQEMMKRLEPTNQPFRKENDLPNLHHNVPC